MELQCTSWAQLTLVISHFIKRIHRGDFGPRGSPYCSINGTKASSWFLAVALPAELFRRFVTSRMCNFSWLAVSNLYRRMTVLQLLTVVKWASGLRMILSKKLSTIPVRSYGIYCVKAKVDWSTGIKELDWSQRNSFWVCESLKWYLWQSFGEKVVRELPDEYN